MQHIPDYRQFVNEGVNLKAAHLSSAEYQKAKKLKAFNSADWTWNPKSQLYDKVNESLVTEGSRRDPESIRKEYKELKKASISYLRTEWSRSFRVGDPKGTDKTGLISDILRARHGNKHVDAAFESLVTEAKFFRLPNKLNAMWELKNSVDYIVGKHSNGDDYNPAEMKTIEEFIKKIKKSAKAFKDSEEVKGTIYESSVNEGPGKGYYIKVGTRDTKKALSILDNMYGKKFDINGSDTYYFKDEDVAYDAMMDLGARDIPVTDTNIEESLDEKAGPCWDGYKIGSPKTKISSQSGKRVNNCVPIDESVTEAKRAGLSKKETLKVAQKFAAALTKLDGKKYTVSKDYEEDSFDLDIDGDEYAGGSYNINDDGSVVNMATWNRKTNVSPTYGNMNDDIKTIIKTIKNINVKGRLVSESAMSELDLLAKEAKDFKAFTKEVFKEFKNLPKKADTLKWLEELYNDAINEAEKAEGDRSKLSAEIEKALKDKATESGVPIGLLRLVMRRGLDAWNSSHRAGVPQVAWGYARVNAFLEKGKGTWGKADADIAKEVRDEGKAGKLPIKNPSEFTKKEREA